MNEAAPGRPHRSGQHKPRRPFRVVLASIVVVLAAWLITTSMAPATGLFTRGLMLLIACLLLVHLVLWQFGAISVVERVKRWPRPLAVAFGLLAMASSPMAIYPLGLLAVVVALITGGTAGSALGVAGGLMILPVVAIFAIGLLFALSRHKGR
jgi:hypothetical protein